MVELIKSHKEKLINQIIKVKMLVNIIEKNKKMTSKNILNNH